METRSYEDRLRKDPSIRGKNAARAKNRRKQDPAYAAACRAAVARWRELNVAPSQRIKMTKAELLASRRRSAKIHRERIVAEKIKGLYGLSRIDYEFMAALQQGKCAICHLAPQLPPEDGRRSPLHRLHVDHDHATGLVRALLCFHCNLGLGRFRDNPELLRTAATYIEWHL